MSTAVKTKTVVVASKSVSAGATEELPEIDMSTGFGGILTGKITNGGSAPTSNSTLTLHVGHETGDENEVIVIEYGQINSEIMPVYYEVSEKWKFFHGDFVCGATNAVTVEFDFMQVMSVA